MEESQKLSSEIKLLLPKRYEFKECLARVARVIDWSGRYYPQSSGYDYMIGTDNNWWMSASTRTNELIIARRYPDLELMKNLEAVLMHLLGADPPIAPPTVPGQINFAVPENVPIHNYLARITQIIDWEDVYFMNPANPQRSFYVGGSGNWLIGFNQEETEIRVDYRLGTTAWMSKLRQVLLYLLDVQRFNQ